MIQLAVLKKKMNQFSFSGLLGKFFSYSLLLFLNFLPTELS